MVIKLRPHHLLCLPRFRGEGYGEDFVRKAQELSEALVEPDSTIMIVLGPDDLCTKCPHMDECPGGNAHKLARDLDNLVLDATGLPLAKEISSKDAMEKVAKAIPLVDMVCTGCQWLDTCNAIDQEK